MNRTARRGTSPWDGLRDELRRATQAELDAATAAELGLALRASLSACLAIAPSAHEVALTRYAEELEGFERLGRQDRAVILARGLRLCASVAVTLDTRPPAAKRRAEPSPPVVAPRMAVNALPGVGPQTAAKLQARGLFSVVDLAYVLPVGYEDRRHRKPLAQIEDGEVAVLEGEAGGLRQGYARGRFMATLQLRVDDGEGGVVSVAARWFHRVGGLERWTKGGRLVAVGPLKRFQGEWTMVHPELRPADEPGPGIAVRYPNVEGIPPRTLAKAIRAACAALADPESGFEDALPREVATSAELPGQREALELLHDPPQDAPPEVLAALRDATSPAHRRLAFDEFFFFQLALLRDRGTLRSDPARLRPLGDAFDAETLRACLPFEPTAAQWRVLRELEEDMGAGPPMLRLLQGDVGSGKTAVAFAAALAVARSGGQAAFMAPTEILAEQHMRTLSAWCERAGIRVALLTGATPRGARASLLALLAAGQIDLVVGTHALLAADVRFGELGLVVIDEQHRFGVEQRALLRQKGQLPHLLVMTATPIPRTTALCAYGELDVSVLDELPPGRKPTETHLYCGPKGLDTVRRAVAKRVALGDRVFVVCPLVEASEALEVSDVEASAAALRAIMPERRVTVIHGRMPSKEKDAIMTAFREGHADVLVATTVIEVGVDVPDATLIVVEHAERFGLAQLHQLRGRVGRGGGDSWCLLHTGASRGSEVFRRLAVLTETHDGFVVAERDLAMRGPGEVFGTRQAGAPRLRFAGFAGEGTKLLVAAREAARALLERDPDLSAHPEVVRELERRRVDEVVVAADAG